MSKSDQKFTRGLAISVTVLGLVSTILLLNDPPSAAETDLVADLGPSVFEMNSAKLKQLSLMPSPSNSLASGRGIASVTASEETSPSLVEVKCQDENPVVETSQIRLRLKGESCLAEEATSTTIKNNSNGYIATVFHKSDFSFTTDYINLSEGTNSILLSFETPNGPIVKTLTINRSPAAAITSKN